jgi:hypothetical protein
MRDLFIDNNIAKNFSNPQDSEYLKLTCWLMNYCVSDVANKHMYAHLVVSKKLLGEYQASSREATSSSSIPVIINKLMSEGRLIIINNDEIKTFKRKYFTKVILKKLRCNAKDREHIPLVLLSSRKYGLSIDDNFVFDLINFPKFKSNIQKRPELLPYNS